jgi:predicted nuclease with TOPRIM domain
VDTQAIQLHDKVQKLIEQYTLDKKKLTEMETALNEKTKEYNSLKENINKIQSELRTAQDSNLKLNQEKSQLVQKNQELEKIISTFEGFANDLNTRIDDLIPKIEKL